MPEINLEAEQVVEEEEERAPSEKRGGGLLRKKGPLLIAAIVVVEAVVLFAFFSLFSSNESHATADGGSVMDGSGDNAGAGAGAGAGGKGSEEARSQATYEFPKDLTQDGRIDLGKVSITEDNLNNPKADRRVGVTLAIQVTRDTYDEIMAAVEIDENALELVKDALNEEIRIFLLGQGIAKLKTLEVQLRLQDEIEEHLLDRLPQLRDKLTKVYVKDVNFSRY
ncbi:MAG: hypothetical protein AAF581_23395 [Planctomycetota bacterium]